jgi:hypothetical protein
MPLPGPHFQLELEDEMVKAHRMLFVLLGVLVVAAPVAAAPEPADPPLRCERLPFVENVYWTTEYGPAAADVLVEPANMLRCESGDYALCYYSGADPMPCKVDEVQGVAHCECQKLTAGPGPKAQMVEISGILNTCVYIETAVACGVDGTGCARTPDSAPVCDYVESNALMPHADLISTFSFAKVGDFALGCTECQGVYAGCMTAPCYERKNDQGEDVVICDCPLYRGPYQFGRAGDYTCDAGPGLVWSAAYNPAGCPAPPGGDASGGR